jgi:protein-tyrosine phosphatase
MKSTPSPASLKEKVIRNCLSELKMKRKALFDEHRSAPNSSSKLLKAFVSDMYTSAKREENGGSLLRTTVFDDFSDNVEDNELMEQIEDAIRYEVERQIMLENQVFEFLENEEFATISLYEQGEYPVICPICR